MQKEVDTAVEKHRQTPDETAADIFPRLTLEEWESEFPSIDGALQDSIRLNLPGACIRKNISGKDIEIPGTNKVIPNDTYAVRSPSIHASAGTSESNKFTVAGLSHRRCPHEPRNLPRSVDLGSRSLRPRP